MRAPCTTADFARNDQRAHIAIPGNFIYRCLCEKASVEVDACAVPLAAGDTLLFCSDGLWEMVHDQQIAAILTSLPPDPSQTAHALMQAALAGGGADNMSVIVVF